MIYYYSSSLPSLEQVANTAVERNLLSDDYGIEAMNDVATETFQWDEGGNDPFSAVGII